jgi:starvation-inducible outer membrane lipoprotein
VEDEIQVSKPIAAIPALKSVVASEVNETSFTVKAMNIVDLAKWNMQETVKIPTQGKPFSEGQKLASLFSRLEEGHRSDDKNVNILKLRRS